MNRRYGIVNVTRGAFFHRETEEVARAALRGLEEAGDKGFIVDGQAAQIVAASTLPFSLSEDQKVLIIAGVGVTRQTMDLLRSASGLHYISRDAAGVLAVSRADAFDNISAGPESVIVDSVQIARDALKAMREAPGEPFIVNVIDGVASFSKLTVPEVVADGPVAAIVVPAKGEPEVLVTHAAAQDVDMALLGSEAFPATFDDLELELHVAGEPVKPMVERVRIAVDGEVDGRHSVLRLGDLVGEAHRASGLSAREWNNLMQNGRDEAIGAALDALTHAALERAETPKAQPDIGTAPVAVNGVGDTGALEGNAQQSVDNAAAGSAAASEAPAQPAASSEASTEKAG